MYIRLPQNFFGEICVLHSVSNLDVTTFVHKVPRLSLFKKTLSEHLFLRNAAIFT
jgi:hypothetical protein